MPHPRTNRCGARTIVALLAAASAACSSSAVGSDAPAGANDASETSPDAAVVPADRFVTTVVSYSVGPCAGFGLNAMPGIVEGPPVGGGAQMGGLDVFSLGNGGQIVVSFSPNAIVDGDGVDFIVFENPFEIGGNPNDLYAEPGEVSVSDDGTTWTSFPCTQTTQAPPYQQCAGINPVYSAPTNGISPFDPSTAGGDAYDLATIGVTHARFVRIKDIVTSEPCPAMGGPGAPDKNGFDLDAVAIVHGELPSP